MDKHSSPGAEERRRRGSGGKGSKQQVWQTNKGTDLGYNMKTAVHRVVLGRFAKGTDWNCSGHQKE